MSSDNRTIGFPRAAACLCLAAALALAAGCDKRTLGWTCAPEAPGVLAAAKTAAVVQDGVGPRREGLEQRELAGALAEELMKRGYSVVYLHEPPLAAVSVAPSAAPSTQPASGAVPASTQPTGVPAGDSPRILVALPSLVGDLSARYAAAREARADILVEVTARVETRVDVYDAGDPYVHYGAFGRYGRHGRFGYYSDYGWYGPYWGYGYHGREVYVREWRSISRATLRVTNPRDQTLLATVTVQYANPTDEPGDVAKDLCLGLDFIRQGWPPQQITLKGRPEKVEIKPPVAPPPSAATRPTSQP